jgi:hypothetical protein
MDALIQDLLYAFSHEQDALAVQCEPQEGLRSVRFRLSLPLSTWMIFSQSAQNKVLNALMQSKDLFKKCFDLKELVECVKTKVGFDR